jgi:DNA-binding LytR/AlgR family response regulator
MSNEFDSPGTALDTIPSLVTKGVPLHYTAPKRSVQVGKASSKPHLGRTCFVRDRTGLVRVPMASIRLVRAEGNYVELLTDHKRYMLRNSLGVVVAQLNDPRFIQVNRSTVVNIHRVQRVDHDAVEIDDELVSLSRGFRNPVLKSINVLCGR